MYNESSFGLCVSSAMCRIRETGGSFTFFEDCDPLEELMEQTRTSGWSDLYPEILDELACESQSWLGQAYPLLDFKNLRLDRLLPKDGRSWKQPVVFLKPNITSKNNLVVDWFPTPHGDSYSDNQDYICCDTSPFNSWPMAGNRLIMVHKFQRLFKRENQYLVLRQTDLRSHRLLLQAAMALIQEIISFLQDFATIRLLNKIQWVHAEGTDGTLSGEPIGFKIVSAAMLEA